MEDDDAALIPAKQECLGVLEFARERLGFEPDAQQTAVLGSSAKRGILNCTRQWGKSTVAGIKAVHRAFSAEENLVIVASPVLRSVPASDR
jgi:hypothetical protein